MRVIGYISKWENVEYAVGGSVRGRAKNRIYT